MYTRFDNSNEITENTCLRFGQCHLVLICCYLAEEAGDFLYEGYYGSAAPGAEATMTGFLRLRSGLGAQRMQMSDRLDSDFSAAIT
jgi:hypothetical protein